MFPVAVPFIAAGASLPLIGYAGPATAGMAVLCGALLACSLAIAFESRAASGVRRARATAGARRAYRVRLRRVAHCRGRVRHGNPVRRPALRFGTA